MKDHKSLLIWQRSHLLAKKAYLLLKLFPRDERFNLISQMKRSVLSVPTNIAEGCGRQTKKEFKRYLVIASGSLTEFEYLTFFSSEVGYLNQKEYKVLQREIIELKKMITSYKNKVSS